MKKIFAFAIALIILIAPCVVLAGSQEATALYDKYYKVQSTTPGNDTLNFKPTWNGTSWVWKAKSPDSILTPGNPPANTILPGNGYLVLAMENLRVRTNQKLVTIRISYTGTGPLQLNARNFGSENGQGSVGQLLSESNSGGTYQLVYQINPQPDWEWFIIKNTGGTQVTLTEVAWGSNCTSVPSLTTWGLLVLALLMAGAAFVVIRRRSLAVA